MGTEDQHREDIKEIFSRMDKHEKECVKLHCEHQHEIEKVSDSVERVSARQKLILWGMLALACIEIFGLRDFGSWLLTKLEIGV